MTYLGTDPDLPKDSTLDVRVFYSEFRANLRREIMVSTDQISIKHIKSTRFFVCSSIIFKKKRTRTSRIVVTHKVFLILLINTIVNFIARQ
jgi:hypothetical protein